MSEERPNTAGGSTTVRSTINKPWLIRIVVIALALVAYGAWSLYDAYVAYPARGEAYASYAEWVYLGKAIEADQSESPGVLRREARVEDPRAELDRLRSEEVAARNAGDMQGTSRPKRAAMEVNRERWLTSLSRIGRLHAAYTTFNANPDPAVYDELIARRAEATPDAARIRELESRLGQTSARDRFNDLNARWTAETPPGPLASYDIPVNKIQAFGCFAFALYLVFLFIRVATRTYRWQPDSKTLTLPSGASIAPAELDDVDKRKWDKFIVFLKVKPDHASLGGREIKVDTYRHGLVEGWILEMEKVAFPDRVEDEPDAAKASDAGQPDAADRNTDDAA